MEEVSNFCPAMAVPMTVKIPEPMTAPMPSAVSDQGPSVFFSRCSGFSDSAISLSIDFLAKNCDREKVSFVISSVARDLDLEMQIPRRYALRNDKTLTFRLTAHHLEALARRLSRAPKS